MAKNNRAVLPNCAQCVTTYRKTFVEVHYLDNLYRTTNYQTSDCKSRQFSVVYAMVTFFGKVSYQNEAFLVSLILVFEMYGNEEVVLSIQIGDVISNMSDMQCFMARPNMEKIAENRIDVQHIKLEIFDLVMKQCQMLNVSASQRN